MALSNFAALESHIPEVSALGVKAEAAFAADPRAAMTHLRVFGERLAIEALDRQGLHVYAEDQFGRLKRLKHDAGTDPRALDAFHTLRKEGNKAVHAYGAVSHGDAMTMLKASHRLVHWFWATYTPKTPPPPGPLVRPEAKAEPPRALKQALAQAEADKEATRSELDALLRLMEMPQVATHSGIESAFAALSETDQEQVGAFLQRFREEPLHADWPLETPEGMADDKVRFVRTGEHVVTVIAPPRGDILLVVHVGTEAGERAWAATRRFEVHPTIGTLQVFDVEAAEARVGPEEGALFAAFGDDDLLAVGLPEALLGAVRRLATEDDLDALSEALPPEASDGLYLLAAGYDLEQALSELQRAKPPAEVDVEDFAVAVHHPDSKRSFRVVDAPEELEAALTGSVEAWRIYLHPDQRRLVEMNANGPIRVLGGAGTGKTVALLHRARHLLEEVFDADQSLLVTTFTKNLAADLRHNLAKLVGDADLERVEIANLHALLHQMWSRHGDGRGLATKGHVERAWRAAMTEEVLGLSESFYAAEWEQVCQARDATEEVAYLRARRHGRGVPLTRGKRRDVWRVFAAYRRSLEEDGVLEAADQMRVLRAGLEDGSILRPFRSALADEAQDFGAPELRFLRALVAEDTNDLFLVGDAHQRIYGYPVVMGHCGIEIVGRSRRLRVNYRTTAKVRSFAVRALGDEDFDDLDGGADTLDGYRSLRLGVDPTVLLLDAADEERDAVYRQVQAWALCVAAPTNQRVSDFAEYLEDGGIPVTVIQSDASDQGDGVRLATFHRLKGLEFPRMVLTGVQEGAMPQRVRAYYELNAEDRAVWDRQQRCLLYVAASRARDELVVTGWGKPSPFLGSGR